MAARLIDERGDLGALEGDRRALGVVLVVGGHSAGGVDNRGVVTGERGDPQCRRGAILDEQRVYSCGVDHLNGKFSARASIPRG